MTIISIANINYLGTKKSGKEPTLFFLKMISQFMDTTPPNNNIVQNALFSDFKEVEDDSKHYRAAELSRMDVIIIRGVNDFKSCTILVFTPSEFSKLNP